MGINKNQLKVYAAKARTDFTNAVVARAAKFGVFADRIVPAREQGDLLIIDSITYKKADIGVAYAKLIEKVRKVGFEETMNEAAYTWFNRFVALRYMELNNLLPHGYKVIGDDRPEILLNANHLTMPGLNKTKVTDMLLAGTQDEELYEYILLTQLAELNKSLPFLFEKMDAATTLLMPDNLLASDSVRTNLLALEIDNFKEIEVVGWLYQFYISEQKDKLMERGTAYTKEEIPAVTQLFTPNWIVKYMVQNSLGAKWLETYPHSTLKGKMEYYIEPAEQTPEVQAELNALKEDRINPEEIKILDPACGSGHILVEAYDLLKEIYLERGYNRRDIPELIITKNLYGLDIDLRAVQLASFAVAMKALKDNPRLINAEIKPNIMAIDETNALNKLDLVQKLLPPEKVKEQEALMALLDNFENGKTYGSLIKIAPVVCEKLPLLKTLVNEALLSGHIFASSAAEKVLPFIKMAEILATKYDCVVANPPYMSFGRMNEKLKKFIAQYYFDVKYDLFSAFIQQNICLSKSNGFLGFMTPFVWMFISSYEKLRKQLIEKCDLTSLVQLEYCGFEGAMVPVCTFTLSNRYINHKINNFIKLSDFRGPSIQGVKTLEAIKNKDCGWFFKNDQNSFAKIPNYALVFWISDNYKSVFNNHKLVEYGKASEGVKTGNNDKYLRFWQEISMSKIPTKWNLYHKGGDYRRWYGNIEHVILWENDGQEIKSSKNSGLQGSPFYNKEMISWSKISCYYFGVRYLPGNIMFDSGSPGYYSDALEAPFVLALLSSNFSNQTLKYVNPTMNTQVGDVNNFPIPEKIDKEKVLCLANKLISFHKQDWDSFETSWDFGCLPMLSDAFKKETLAKSYQAWCEQNAIDIAETTRLEEENNSLFIEAYKLKGEVEPKVLQEQITLTVNPYYRYKNSGASDEELESRFKADSMKELISYAIGCYMGRYSLDKTGLVYANEKNIGFDATKYQTIPADGDGIIPLTDTCWFPEEDMVNRLVDFVKTVWGQETLAENLDFIASGLDRKSTETAVEAIRRYLTKDFYKNHLQMYKNRPIYWLFSSGKEKAFECLVYMHRMNEQTLAHIRMQFVVPLISKMNGALENMDKDIAAADSSAKQRQLNKEKEKLVKQYAELNKFDDALNHAINERITMDLDDGVKVNYAKFAPLVAESKKVVGK